MPEYSIVAVVAAVAVVLYETRRLRTGLFRSPSYWATMAISLFFMILADGWLTKRSAPIVRYNPDRRSPWRFPFDIPVEDLLYGYALLTWVLLRWKAQDGRNPVEDERARGLPWKSSTGPSSTSPPR
jgi:lycopene cyclase domain-containing protein